MPKKLTSWLRSAVLGGLLALGGLVVAAPLAHADPATSVKLANSASAVWVGPSGAGGQSIGTVFGAFNNDAVNGMVNLGDVNGDGRDDTAVTHSSGAYVLFSPPNATGTVDLGNLSPADGYRLVIGAPPAVIGNVGDQNDDGIDDVGIGDGFTAAFILYSLADPSSLDPCSVGSPTRCLDGPTMDIAEGYKVTSTTAALFANGVSGIGDFNGDNIDDFAVSDPAAGGKGETYVISGGLDPVASPVSIQSLSTSELTTVVGSQSGGFLGVTLNGVGDFNDDGFTDLFIDESSFSGSELPMGYVIYGGEAVANPMDLGSFETSFGFRIGVPVLSIINGVNAGDVNGDGRPDLALGGTGLTDPGGSGAVLYGPEETPSTPISMTAPTNEQGYRLDPGDPGGWFGSSVVNAGDLNADGIPDQFFGSPRAAVNTVTSAGYGTFLLGQRPTPESPFTLGPDLVPDRGVAITGSTTGQRAALSAAAAGDLDGDGIPDYFVAAPGVKAGSTIDAGAAYIVPGSSLVPDTNTGKAAGVRDTSATLTGAISGTRGEGDAHFEWGTSTEYGQVTADQTMSGTNSVDAHLDGLAEKTTYHYRLVGTNGLGMTRYGADRTFTTEATPQVLTDPCTLNPTGPGCCEKNPTAAGCQVKPDPAALKFRVSPKSKKAKRGKKATFTAKVSNTGDVAAQGVKICVKAPKKLVKVKKCVKVGSIAAGATKRAKFKVTVKKKAKRRKKITLKFIATGKGLAKKTGKVRVKVK